MNVMAAGLSSVIFLLESSRVRSYHHSNIHTQSECLRFMSGCV